MTPHTSALARVLITRGFRLVCFHTARCRHAPAWRGPHIWGLRQRASAYGHSAESLQSHKTFTTCGTRCCRQEGCLDTANTLLGFAAYKYVPGVGLLPHLNDAFKPASTAFAVAAGVDTGSGFCYAHSVEECSAVCPQFERLESDENYVGVSTPATVQMQRSRDKLNLASTFV